MIGTARGESRSTKGLVAVAHLPLAQTCHVFSRAEGASKTFLLPNMTYVQAGGRLLMELPPVCALGEPAYSQVTENVI